MIKKLSLLVILFTLICSTNSFAKTAQTIIGSRILTSLGHYATVSETSDTGVKIVFDGEDDRSAVWPMANLAKTSGCSTTNKDFCVGTSVLTDKGYRSGIAGIFSNGDVAISYTYFSVYAQNYVLFKRIPINQLSKI